jgi:hypothetical protein
MAKKLLTLLFTSVLAFPLSMAVLAQEAPAQAKAAQSARWEGIVAHGNKQKSVLTVRARASNNEKIIHYDSSTRFTSQEHGSKKVNDIDASQVNEGDRVICVGYYDEKGEFRAALISKRLSQ